MVDNITVNTQNSIRITSRVGVIYIDPLEIPDGRWRNRSQDSSQTRFL